MFRNKLIHIISLWLMLHIFHLTIFDVVIVGQIGPFQSTKSERAKVKVKVRLNLHGVVSIESATVSFTDS